MVQADNVTLGQLPYLIALDWPRKQARSAIRTCTALLELPHASIAAQTCALQASTSLSQRAAGQAQTSARRGPRPTGQSQALR